MDPPAHHGISCNSSCRVLLGSNSSTKRLRTSMRARPTWVAVPTRFLVAIFLPLVFLPQPATGLGFRKKMVMSVFEDWEREDLQFPTISNGQETNHTLASLAEAEERGNIDGEAEVERAGTPRTTPSYSDPTTCFFRRGGALVSKPARELLALLQIVDAWKHEQACFVCQEDESLTAMSDKFFPKTPSSCSSCGPGLAADPAYSPEQLPGTTLPIHWPRLLGHPCQDKTSLILLPCQHRLHAHCLEQWFRKKIEKDLTAHGYRPLRSRSPSGAVSFAQIRANASIQRLRLEQCKKVEVAMKELLRRDRNCGRGKERKPKCDKSSQKDEKPGAEAEECYAQQSEAQAPDEEDFPERVREVCQRYHSSFVKDDAPLSAEEDEVEQEETTASDSSSCSATSSSADQSSRRPVTTEECLLAASLCEILDNTDGIECPLCRQQAHTVVPILEEDILGVLKAVAKHDCSRLARHNFYSRDVADASEDQEQEDYDYFEEESQQRVDHEPFLRRRKNNSIRCGLLSSSSRLSSASTNETDTASNSATSSPSLSSSDSVASMMEVVVFDELPPRRTEIEQGTGSVKNGEDDEDIAACTATTRSSKRGEVVREKDGSAEQASSVDALTAAMGQLTLDPVKMKLFFDSCCRRLEHRNAQADVLAVSSSVAGRLLRDTPFLRQEKARNDMKGEKRQEMVEKKRKKKHTKSSASVVKKQMHHFWSAAACRRRRRATCRTLRKGLKPLRWALECYTRLDDNFKHKFFVGNLCTVALLGHVWATLGVIPNELAHQLVCAGCVVQAMSLLLSNLQERIEDAQQAIDFALTLSFPCMNGGRQRPVAFECKLERVRAKIKAALEEMLPEVEPCCSSKDDKYLEEEKEEEGT
ncbi:unnamed protein product [Amoebophrya sp. A120]|nr:unnamed protein product [Amoebophrya sp. A120]|eukprot:GSA120T00012827001.1